MRICEKNLLNTIYVLPQHVRYPSSYCPREEIADPAKLFRCVYMVNSWDTVQLDDACFFRGWIPWRKQYNFDRNKETVTSSGVYVFTRSTVMFQTLRELLETRVYSKAHIAAWLHEWWNEVFLITSPIYVSEPGGYAYSINNRYFVQRVPIVGTFDSSRQLVMSHCYTMCNGLTLLIALHRLGIISASYVAFAVQQLKQHHPDFFQEVTEPWHEIYYGHFSPHVADHPYIYACMGEKPASLEVIRACQAEDDYDSVLTQFGWGETRVYTSLPSAILTYFHRELWDRFILHDMWPLLPPMDDDDTLSIDLVGFTQGIISSRRSWKWWLQNNQVILERLHSVLGGSQPLLEAWLNPICFLYKHAKSFPKRLCYRRLRSLWNMLLQTYDPNGQLISGIFHNDVFKHHIVHNMTSAGILIIQNYCPIPFSFLKELFNRCFVDVYAVRANKIYSKHIDLLQQLYPNGTIRNDADETPYVHIQTTTMDLLQTSRNGSPYWVFFHTFLKKKIAQRLLAIIRGFGMRENEYPTVTNHPDAHLVGMIMLDYARDHKELLLY